MTVALDLGSTGIRSLRREDEALRSRTSRCVYSVLPDSPAHRRLLEQGDIPFTTCEEGILLLGDGAFESADLFKAQCRPLIANGRLPKGDPLVRQLVSSLVEVILPTASERNEICSLTLPGGAALDSSSEARADLEFFIRLVRLQGYQPRLLPASQALILAELVETGFTGVGMVFGASSCEAILSHRGNPICHAASDRGGEWIDDQLLTKFPPPGEALQERETDHTSAHSNLDRITQRREQIETPLTMATDEFAAHTSKLLHDVIHELCDGFCTELIRSRSAKELPSPLPVVCAGGLSATQDFHSLLFSILQGLKSPVPLQSPKIIGSDQRSITRGLLISGELEAMSHRDRKAA